MPNIPAARFGPAEQLMLGILFLTRLPLRLGSAPPADGLARAVWSFPLVGAIVGLAGTAAALAADGLGLPPLAAALLALATTMVLSGALHEDGLADTVDGFGGGRTVERKLEIMKDSRIGSYGVLALVVGTGLRAAALAVLVEDTRRLQVLGGLVAAHAGGRALMPLLMRRLPAARPGGLGASAGVPPALAVAAALLLGAAAVLGGLGPWRGLAGILLALVAALLVGALARRQIGGYTGDVLGAVQQVGEIVLLLVAAAQLPS